MAMFFMTLFVFITLAFRDGSFYYYFTYFVDAAAMARLLEGMGLVAADAAAQSHGIGHSILNAFGLIVKEGADPSRVGFSLFLMAGSLVNIIGALLAKLLADRFGKKAVFTIGLAGAALVQATYVVLRLDDIRLMFLFTVLASLSYGPPSPCSGR
jgi:Na+/melibiose symporter-like transporter